MLQSVPSIAHYMVGVFFMLPTGWRVWIIVVSFVLFRMKFPKSFDLYAKMKQNYSKKNLPQISVDFIQNWDSGQFHLDKINLEWGGWLKCHNTKTLLKRKERKKKQQRPPEKCLPSSSFHSLYFFIYCRCLFVSDG